MLWYLVATATKRWSEEGIDSGFRGDYVLVREATALTALFHNT